MTSFRPALCDVHIPEENLMSKFAPYAKAVLAAAIAGLGALGTALTDGSVSTAEWVAVASAVVVALGVVWGVPNKPPQP